MGRKTLSNICFDVLPSYAPKEHQPSKSNRETAWPQVFGFEAAVGAFAGASALGAALKASVRLGGGSPAAGSSGRRKAGLVTQVLPEGAGRVALVWDVSRLPSGPSPARALSAPR